MRIIIDNRKIQPAPPNRATRVYSPLVAIIRNSAAAITEILV
jgi:hypothetical protein